MTLRDIARKYPDLKNMILEDLLNGEDKADILAFYKRIALERINNEFFKEVI